MKKLRNMVLSLLLGVSILSMGTINVKAAEGDYYTIAPDSKIACQGGGNLISHAERQTYGTLSGNVRKVMFYVYAKYDGTQAVDSIKCEWSTGATLRNSATMTLSTSVGTQYSFGASTSSTWQSVTSTPKYWLHTTGTTVSYENSNFTIAPDADLLGYQFWITTTGTVYTKGYLKPTTISNGC